MKNPKILAIDAGGTMTDTFIIDEKGEFVVGKAQTTSENEAIGFLNSAKDALSYWNMDPEEVFPKLVSGIYSGTSMLNRLLERKGKRLGLIVTAGMEDYLHFERSIQTYLGYSYADKLHVNTHRHNEPLVPKRRIRGVRERIDVFGDVVIPLYEKEVEQAVNELLDQNIDYLCVNFLFSYKNDRHEKRVKEIAHGVFNSRNQTVPIFLSSDLYPVSRDFPRLNTLLIEAYAAEPSRAQLQVVRDSTKELGARFDLRVMASHGGTISMDAKELARTLISGPIGGVIGAKYLVDQMGNNNVLCTDIGGTSFDLALITGGEYQIKPNPNLDRFLLNLPLVQIDSLGAGTGSFVRVNPTSNRIEIGPDSAGSRIGICYEAGNIETPSITDCNVVLGVLNPDYFLGGDVKLNKERAFQAIREQIAEPLGIDVYTAAAGAVELFEDSLKNAVVSQILGKGYSPVNYTLLSYGGGGPLHVGGYTGGLEFEDVIVPSWAAGFSAFGCACADFEYRYDKTVDLSLSSNATDLDKSDVYNKINDVWIELRAKVILEFMKSGFKDSDIYYRSYLRIQYRGQLNDLEIRCDVNEINNAEQFDRIIANFEEMYGRVYALAAKSPELGYTITSAIVTGSVEVEKPRLPLETIETEFPPEDASKGQRDVYWHGEWLKADIWQMEKLKAGNIIIGLSIIESPATTFVVPPGRVAYLDEHRIFHLRKAAD